VDKTFTIPNILKGYNPSVTGYSKGLAVSAIGIPDSIRQLNMADGGATSEAVPEQARDLVERMKTFDGVNFEEDWKLITLFIGGNDLCSFCDDKERYSAENYRDHIQEALDHLHDNVPRAFVNLVTVLDIFIVKRLSGGLVCDALHLYGCSCAAFPANSDAEAELVAETERYRRLTEELVHSGRYDTRDDFTVVVQPFWTDTVPPDNGDGEPDLSYFAPDCFHLSLKGHKAAAEALWNNMEPVGLKRLNWTPGEAVECPSEENPYLYTYQNSDRTQGFGVVGQNQEQDIPNSKHAKNSQDSGYIIATVTVSSAIAVSIVAMVVVGVLLWKKRRQGRPEREILLQTNDITIYT